MYCSTLNYVLQYSKLCTAAHVSKLCTAAQVIKCAAVQCVNKEPGPPRASLNMFIWRRNLKQTNIFHNYNLVIKINIDNDA